MEDNGCPPHRILTHCTNVNDDNDDEGAGVADKYLNGPPARSAAGAPGAAVDGGAGGYSAAP